MLVISLNDSVDNKALKSSKSKTMLQTKGEFSQQVREGPWCCIQDGVLRILSYNEEQVIFLMTCEKPGISKF